ncbi:MAG: PaaI family thioesterase [Coriobacteriales bacterium]|jgi:acyl-CoA thioesterase|nr:PaaI family thioesterase [Coriobacteriales bacterium]
MTSEDLTLEQVRAHFALDRFATEACMAVITEAERGHAICEMTVDEIHLNAMGNVMGGAIFTLADYALAVACNVGEAPTVAISNSISFINTIKGQRLIAECQVDKSGRSIGFYTTTVTDELGTLVAIMTATCFRKV